MLYQFLLLLVCTISVESISVFQEVPVRDLIGRVFGEVFFRGWSDD